MDIYEQATREVALVDLSHRCWIEVKGDDSRKFLNSILTNNIQALRGKSGCYAAVCTPKGKMLADLFCYTCGNYFGIDCNVSLKPTIMENLKRYIIFQKVVLEDKSDKWGACAVLGPKSQEFLASLVKSIPTLEFEYLETELEELKIWVIHKKLWGFPCHELWVTRTDLPALKKRLNLTQLDCQTSEVLRIESATPLFGVDMDENTIPQEANLYNALSFNKGCYVGQEIIARLESRGHVGKKIVQLKISGDTQPQKGDKIFSVTDEEVGIITSSCFSPQSKFPIALGYIRYAFLNAKEVFVKTSTGKVVGILS